MDPVEFQVNAETCIRCGMCAKDCLIRIIEMRDVPQIAEENRSKCVHCGHCQAICPTASIILDGIQSSQLESMPDRLSENDVAGLIKGRRSVREYSSEAVDPNTLEKIVNIATYAPTATNSRQISYLIVNGRPQVEKLLDATVDVMERHGLLPQVVADVRSGWDKIFRGAPCVLITHAPAELPFSGADCATVIGTLELMLPSFGLASCWAGLFTRMCWNEIPAVLPIPEGNKIFGALMMGKPEVTYKRIPYRKRPKMQFLDLQ